MQPYLFPYLGYFQLLRAADRFVVYDDVAFIKQGWINRNQILVGGSAFRFSVPLDDASSFRPIMSVHVDGRRYHPWLRKFLATVDQSYRRAPFYREVRSLVANTLSGFEGSIAALALRTIEATADYLNVDTEIVATSASYGNEELHGQGRVIDICLREQASDYVNLSGGRSLYSSAAFGAHGIQLRFLETNKIQYAQLGQSFVPNLSIIDVMMFNTPGQLAELLRSYTLSP